MLMVFKKIWSHIRYLLLCVCYNIKSSVANRKSFVIQTVAMFINNFVFILFWYILFLNKGGYINGINMQDMLYIWSIPVMGYGIAYFCFGGLDTLCKSIVDGNLDVHLTKPKHSLISELTSRSILSAMGDFLSGAVCGIIAVNFNPIKFIWLIVLSIISGILFTSIVTTVELLSFWLGDITNACKKYTDSLLVTLTIYPEQMFSAVIKFSMYTVIPAMYVAHIPVRLMKTFTLEWLAILIIATILFTALMFFVYNKGLKKYESGNGVTKR